MNNNLSLADMKTKIISSAYPDSNTNTADAILTAKDMLLNGTHREGSPRIMAIFTDGAPNSITYKNYNQVTNQICNEMSKSYSKYDWICIVGEKMEISEHQVARTLFQFGFQLNSTDFYIIVNAPDDSR